MGIGAVVIMLKVSLTGCSPNRAKLTKCQCLKAAEMLYAVAMALVKVSLVQFYSTIFSIRGFQRLAWIAMALSVATAVASILDAFLGCHPFEYNWDKTIPDGTCGNQLDQFLAYLIPCAINLLVHAFVVVLPWPFLWTLQMAPYARSPSR